MSSRAIANQLSGNTNRRMEKQVIKNCCHPAVRDPWHYAIDFERQLFVLLAIVALLIVAWLIGLFVLDRADAPDITHSALGGIAIHSFI